MTRYFANFQDALDPAEADAVALVKPSDPGGDVLPFGHLEDRRFEILVYRLKYVELERSGARVSLMQGVGERGRDVIVHSPSGVLTQIVQCKKYEERFTAPALRKELLKLALHHHLDPSILGSGPVTYELWCPAGLTERAAKLFDSWPKGWTFSELTEDALEVIERYVAFRKLSWDGVGECVVDEFQKHVRPRLVGGIDISARVRAALPIYESFFQGKIVMERGDVFDALQAFLSKQPGFAALSDQDAKHVLERIASFPPGHRLVQPSGYVMGLAPELVSRFNRKEYEAFAKHVMQGTAGIIQVVLDACARLADDTAQDFRERVRPANNNLTHVLVRTLMMSMISRVNGMLFRGLSMQPSLESYNESSLRQRLEHHARETWDQHQRCLAGYDASKHAFGSDEEFRSRIAVHGLGGATDRAEFERCLLCSIDEHIEEIESSFNVFMSIVPKEILLIADTMTVFDNEALFRRMEETINLLTRLRGSAIIPE